MIATGLYHGHRPRRGPVTAWTNIAASTQPVEGAGALWSSWTAMIAGIAADGNLVNFDSIYENLWRISGLSHNEYLARALADPADEYVDYETLVRKSAEVVYSMPRPSSLARSPLVTPVRMAAAMKSPWAPATIKSRHGISVSRMQYELEESKSYFEALTGQRVRSWAHPYHSHDRLTMVLAKQAGFICARDGDPYGTGSGEPRGGFLLGPHSDTRWRQHWDHWTPWEMPLTATLYERVLTEVLSASEMEDLLYDTANYNATYPGRQPVGGYLYGYASFMEMWKDNNSWVQFYVHGNPAEYELPVAQLGWLLDAVVADGAFWMSDAGTIAAYAHARHVPSAADPLVYEPDGAYGATPWNGKTCAFTFSSDDGRDANLGWADECLARTDPASGGPVRMTAYLTKNYVGISGDHMTEAEIIQLAAKGNVEIGCHSVSHPRLINEDVIHLRPDAGRTKAVGFTVADDAGWKIKFYEET